MIPDSILKVHHRERAESEIKSALLMILLSKTTRFLTEIPADWEHCLHIDVSPHEGWLDKEFLQPSLNFLVGCLANMGRIPLDICAVKNDSIYAIVVRTTEPSAKLQAAS